MNRWSGPAERLRYAELHGGLLRPGGSPGPRRRLRPPPADPLLVRDDAGQLVVDTRVYDVTVGPVPCLARVERFGPWMDPRCWDEFVTGVRIEPITIHEHANGWRGRVLEILGFDVDGQGPLDLHTVLDVDFFHDGTRASVDFTLVESREGVLTRDEGYIRATPVFGGRAVGIVARKILQLAPDAPQNLLAPFIPAMLRGILTVWLWEYSLGFMARRPDGPPDDAVLQDDEEAVARQLREQLGVTA